MSAVSSLPTLGAAGFPTPDDCALDKVDDLTRSVVCFGEEGKY